MVTSTSAVSPSPASCRQRYLMAASAAFTVDLRKGSVSRGNSRTTVTLQGSPSCWGAATAGWSATILLSTRFFFVPAYVTVASASIISWGYNCISWLFRGYLGCFGGIFRVTLLRRVLAAALRAVVGTVVVEFDFYIGLHEGAGSGQSPLHVLDA